MSLEKEFVRFLASNTITGPDWEKLKVEEPDKAEALIGIFSDIVFEQTLKKARYLELKTPQDFRAFHCLDDKIHMIGIVIDGQSDIDFTKTKSSEEMLAELHSKEAKLKLYKGEKAYKKERELELFELMEKGALISRDGAMYKKLSTLPGQK